MADADDLYICVADVEGGSPVELPLEQDKTLLMTTLDAQFPGAVGIKFLNPKTGVPRGVRRVDNIFHPPTSEGWGDRTYICVFPKAQTVQVPVVEAPVAVAQSSSSETSKAESTNSETEKGKAEDAKQAKGQTAQAKKGKRKIDANGDASSAQVKSAKVSKPPTCDLIMLNLSPKSTEEQLRNYLEKKYGQVKKLHIKTKQNGGSRGFGFVRFFDYDDQRQVLRANHLINGSNVTFDIHDRELVEKPTKLFIQDLTPSITADDIKEYFSEIGDVTDCFIPGKKLIAFVEFHDPNAASFALGSHVIKGTTVRAKIARPMPGAEPQVYQKHEQGGNNPGFRDRQNNRNEFQNNQRRGDNWDNSYNQGPQDSWGDNFDKRGNDYVNDRDSRGRNQNTNYGQGHPSRNIDISDVNLLAAIKTGLDARARKVVGSLEEFRGPPIDSRSDWHGGNTGNKFQSYSGRNTSSGRGRARTPPEEWEVPEPQDSFRNRNSGGYGGQSSQMRGSRNRFN